MYLYTLLAMNFCECSMYDIMRKDLYWPLCIAPSTLRCVIVAPANGTVRTERKRGTWSCFILKVLVEPFIYVYWRLSWRQNKAANVLRLLRLDRVRWQSSYWRLRKMPQVSVPTSQSTECRTVQLRQKGLSVTASISNQNGSWQFAVHLGS